MKKSAWTSEPKILVSGVEGTGKTLFCVEEAFLLTQETGGMLYQLNIRGADPAHLPKLPFKLDEMAFDESGAPVVDPETGDHLPRWAVDLPEGSVVVVDECHKVYPQRGPGRPPKHIEMLAEGRQHGIRFIFMTQNPDAMDKFVRGKINRHFHLERPGNMERATVLEFDHCVVEPSTSFSERKSATVHFWKYPKEFYGWYKSAKSHHFRRRIPLKIWLAIAFIPIAGFLGWRGIAGVRHITSGDNAVLGVPVEGSGVAGGEGRSDSHPIFTDVNAYLKQFEPLSPVLPWSAAAYQGRDVVAEPDLYCMSSGSGVDGQGNYKAESCTCITEQGTHATVSHALCTLVVTQGGVYNPFRAPIGGQGKGRAYQSTSSGTPVAGGAGL